MNRVITYAAGLILAALATAQAVHASVIYTDRTSWTAATSGISIVTFEGIAPDNSYVYQGTSTGIGGVNFSSSNGMYVIGGSYAESGGVFSLGTGAVLFGYSTGISALPGATSAIGFELRGYLEPSTSFTISLSNGEFFSTTVSNPGGGFWGVVTDNPVTSILIDTNSAYGIIDNFSFGSAAVPEPGTLGILSLALLGLAWTRKRKAAKL